MAQRDRALAHDVWLGVALLLAATTPSWLGVMYSVADKADREEFWRLSLWPAFIPLAVALLLLILLLSGVRMPGMPRSDSEEEPGLPKVFLHADEMSNHLLWVDGKRADPGFWLHEPYVNAIGRLTVTNHGSVHKLRLHDRIRILDVEARAPEAASVRPHHTMPGIHANAWSEFQLTKNVEPGDTEEYEVSFALNAVKHMVHGSDGQLHEGWSMPDKPIVTRIEVTDQWNRHHVSPPLTFY